MKTVEEYILDFYRLASLNDLAETEDQLVAQYVSGWKLSIQEKIPLHIVVTLPDAINMATQIEQTASKASRFASTSHAAMRESVNAAQGFVEFRRQRKGTHYEHPCKETLHSTGSIHTSRADYVIDIRASSTSQIHVPNIVELMSVNIVKKKR